MVTIKDIAKACGVAISTVSYALNNDYRIQEATKLKVLAKAKELGYKGKSGTKKSNNDKIRQIVICLNSINGIIYTEIFNSIHHILHISNCKTLIYCGNKVDNLHWMDGLICLNSKLNNEQLKNLSFRRIPIVLMDRNDKINNVSNVIVDNFQGSYDLTKKIIEKGAKSFIYISGPNGNYDSIERFNGFSKALKDSGLPMKNVVIYSGDYTTTSGINICENALSLAIKVDAIVCGNDEMAIGVMKVLQKNGYIIGKNILVGGFDGICDRSYVGFITCTYDRNNYASIAAYSLLRQFETNNTSLTKIPCEVVEY